MGERTALNFLPIKKSAGRRRAIRRRELKDAIGNSGTPEIEQLTEEE